MHCPVQSLVANVIMGLMMISIGVCAALWEDKLRRTPNILKRGYFSNQYQTVFNEVTHPRPGAAAAAAVSKTDRSSPRVECRLP